MSAAPSIYDKSLRIAKRDTSNLYVVSKFFEDNEKFLAFVSFYALMRIVDDEVDSMTERSGDESASMLRYLEEMETNTLFAYEPDLAAGETDPLFGALRASLSRFPIPRRIWTNFFSAMRTDATSSRFASFEKFIEYCEGATVAPTVIFVYILASRRDSAGVYTVPDFDYETCGRNLGIFAYLAHILRDVKEDLDSNLVYLPQRELGEFGVSEEDLRAMSEGAEVSEDFRSLASFLVDRSRDYLRRGKAMAEEMYPRMDLDCHFILRLIIRIYEALLDKIDSVKGDVFSGRHKLGTTEKLKLAFEVARTTSFSHSKVLSVLGAILGEPR